jgi:hypothetical protein
VGARTGTRGKGQRLLRAGMHVLSGRAHRHAHADALNHARSCTPEWQAFALRSERSGTVAPVPHAHERPVRPGVLLLRGGAGAARLGKGSASSAGSRCWHGVGRGIIADQLPVGLICGRD